MTRPSIGIFGGGIAGCTVAHLLCKDYDVHLFEASGQLGGFAKSWKNKQGIPQEHSPRIVLNDYYLFERIFKDLGIEDHLISNPCDKIVPLNGHPRDLFSFGHIGLTYKEMILIVFHIIMGMISTDDDDSQPVYDIIQSTSGREWFDTLALIAGERPDIMPMYKVVRMMESTLYNAFRSNKTLNGPWSEKFFNYWETFLKQNNVSIYYHTPLIQFCPKLKYAIVKQNNQLKYIHTNLSVVATDISNSIKIFNHTNNKISQELTYNLKKLYSKTTSHQMGMQLYFPFQPNVNLKDYFTIESDWKLIIQIQTPRLWSLVIPEMSLTSQRLGKSAQVCTEEELKEEILYQLGQFFSLPLPQIYIWKSWTFQNGKWATTEPYFWNAVSTKHLRPKQEITNTLYLVGAYTDTKYYSYYMEGAVESGFMIAEKILGKHLNIPTRRFPHLVQLILLFSLTFLLQTLYK